MWFSSTVLHTRKRRFVILFIAIIATIFTTNSVAKLLVMSVTVLGDSIVGFAQ